jgi:hypothetical protein
MSEPKESLEKFFVRWSRRKRAAMEHAGDETPAKKESEQSSGQEDTANCSAATAADAALPSFDPASLPPVESIDAASDLRAFLAPGVPVELARAALRRAWASDPAIRDFIGIAENQWDFAKSDGVPGFGPLDLTSDLRRLVSDLYGDPPGVGQVPGNFGRSLDPGNATVDATEIRSTDAAPSDRVEQALNPDGDQAPASPAEAKDSAPERPAIRKHGRALPS